MTPEERERLIGNIVASMKTVPAHIQERQLWHFKKADPAYGAGVARGLGRDIRDIDISNHKEVAAD
jgi:catalase